MMSECDIVGYARSVEWKGCGGVGARGSHTSLVGVSFCVSLSMVCVDTVSYVVAATLQPEPHLMGVGGGTWLMACLWGQP